MPDPTRKLPVIYALLDMGNVCWGAEVHREQAEERKSMGLRVHGSPVVLEIIEYEPAIPRCKTCGNYTQKPDGKRCEPPNGLWVPGAHENGHCHNHTDLK